MKVKNEGLGNLLYMVAKKFKSIITSSMSFKNFLKKFTSFNTNMCKYELLMVTKWCL